METFTGTIILRLQVPAESREEALDKLQGLSSQMTDDPIVYVDEEFDIAVCDYDIIEGRKQSISIETSGGQAAGLGKQLEKQMWDIGVSHMMHLAKPQ